jgi:hypothetical protein
LFDTPEMINLQNQIDNLSELPVMDDTLISECIESNLDYITQIAPQLKQLKYNLYMATLSCRRRQLTIPCDDVTRTKIMRDIARVTQLMM